MLKNQHKQSIFPTLNQYGYSHAKPLKFGQLFVNYCKTVKKPVLDIGAAYGVTTIPALENGAIVIANDIEKRHLDLLKTKIPQEFNSRFQVLLGSMPDNVHFEENSLGAVLASGVLHFLSHEKFLLSIEKIYSFLDIDGLFFFETSSIFNEHFKFFYPTYKANQLNDMPCPGLIENARSYVQGFNNLIPEKLILFSLEEIISIFEKRGFKILRAEYFDNFSSGKTKKIKKSALGVIAQKI